MKDYFKFIFLNFIKSYIKLIIVFLFYWSLVIFENVFFYVTNYVLAFNFSEFSFLLSIRILKKHHPIAWFIILISSNSSILIQLIWTGFFIFVVFITTSSSLKFVTFFRNFPLATPFSVSQNHWKKNKLANPTIIFFNSSLNKINIDCHSNMQTNYWNIKFISNLKIGDSVRYWIGQILEFSPFNFDKNDALIINIRFTLVLANVKFGVVVSYHLDPFL